MKELLAFIEEAQQFSQIKRTIRKPGALDERENDAEHSWHLAMMVLLLHEKHPYLNLEKCLTFAIIHDLPELYAGDTPILSADEKTKHEREEKAMQKILSQLPEPTKARFKELFDEYENKKSKEARFVYELDKIQPMVMNVLANGYSWKKDKLPTKQLRERKLATVSNEFGLRELLDHYHDLALEKNMYYEEK